MISLVFHLSFISLVSADWDDGCWGGSDVLNEDKPFHGTTSRCRGTFVQSVRVSTRQAHDGQTRALSDQTTDEQTAVDQTVQAHHDLLPEHVKLIELDPAQDGTMLNIVHF